MAKQVPLFKEKGVALPSVQRFNAEEELVVGRFGIRWRSEEFKKLITAVVEEDVPSGRGISRELNRTSNTREIIEAVSSKRVLFLADLATLLNNSEEGFLAIVLVSRNPRVIRARWRNDGGGWDMYAGASAGQFGWNAGDKMVSRK